MASLPADYEHVAAFADAPPAGLAYRCAWPQLYYDSVLSKAAATRAMWGSPNPFVVLEIGVGYGFFMDALAAAFSGVPLQYWGVDPFAATSDSHSMNAEVDAIMTTTGGSAAQKWDALARVVMCKAATHELAGAGFSALVFRARSQDLQPNTVAECPTSSGATAGSDWVGASNVLFAPEPHFVFVDGSHAAADVCADLQLAWRLLPPRGVVCIDDYDSAAHSGVADGVAAFCAWGSGSEGLVDPPTVGWTAPEYMTSAAGYRIYFYERAIVA